MIEDDLKNKIKIVDNVIFYGDVHLSKDSRNQIRDIFEKNKDIDCVALETDEKRIKSLTSTPPVFKVLGKLSKKFKINEYNYCGAFKEAIKICDEKKITLKLIDTVPIIKLPTMKVLKALRQAKKIDTKLSDDLNEIKKLDIGSIDDKDIKAFLKNSKKREKNMIEQIYKIKNKYKKLLVIIGYAHMDSIIKGVKGDKK